MAEFDLSSVLVECQKASATGYHIASSQYATLRNTLSNAEVKIKNTALEFSSSPAYFSGATDTLSSQLIDIHNNLNQLSFAFQDDIDTLKDNLSKFSITLFGRTMAGKSTLMEILTNGDGTSIGKGSQRTTRDVRRYEWNGLSITDVPGIGAFEGQEDEQIAFDAAKSADLILFIITDDAPQLIEAECFSRIVALGKPVIGIMNVKVSISSDKGMKLALRDIEKCFDHNRLDAIREQFYTYALKFGQDWHNINFIYVHLKSAFLSQNTDNVDIANKLYEASRISKLKECIFETVTKKGKFYRKKTFIDCIYVPMLSTMENLIAQSLTNSAQGRTILSKKKQLMEWKHSYERDSMTRIQDTINQIKGKLYSEIASFAEDHFDDKNADKAWGQLLKENKVEDYCSQVIFDLQEQCSDKLKEISRSIESELSYISNITTNKTLQMHTIVDGKKIWDWGTLIFGGGLTIGSIIASLCDITICGVSLASPLGWAAAGVAVLGLGGSIFFKSRDRKEQEARKRLEANLKDNVNSNCRKLQSQMIYNFHALIKTIENLSKEIDRIDSVLFKLADTQKEFAWSLDDILLDLNNEIVKEAFYSIDSDGLDSEIVKVARIPGIMSLIMLNDNFRFPEQELKKLQCLMAEKISFIYGDNNPWRVICRTMGKSFNGNRIRIEEKISVAHVNGGSITPLEANKFRIAQQLTKIAIQIEEV